MSTIADDTFNRHPFTVTDYYRMAEVGILIPGERVELIEGEIIDMPPIGSRHAGTVNHLSRILQRAVGDNAIVQVQNPIRLSEYSEPEPDIALVLPRVDFYKSAHPGPGDVLLVIEVADTTLVYDRTIKAPLYARHGIPECWIVDVEGRKLERYRAPHELTYVLVDRPDLGETIAPAALPNVGVGLGALFE
ncbi:MAG TPA: Uma2 family endonuclease [Gammaproteobacteria bacterium]|nr:Uma2 family endonuclease [Gammaproteobacteria bacterium]